MKRKILLLCSFYLALCLTACGSTATPDQTSSISEGDSKVESEVSSVDNQADASEFSSVNEGSSEESSMSESKAARTTKITVVSREPESESKLESEIESRKECKEVYIGDNITTDFCEMSIESYKISKTFDYTMKNWNGDTVPVSIDAGEGKTYLIFTGIYKNTSGDRLSPTISAGDVLINETYNYSLLFWENDHLTNGGVIRYIGGLDPLESNRYYGMIVLPDETANTLTKCEIDFSIRSGKSSDYKNEEYRLIINNF